MCVSPSYGVLLLLSLPHYTDLRFFVFSNGRRKSSILSRTLCKRECRNLPWLGDYEIIVWRLEFCYVKEKIRWVKHHTVGVLWLGRSLFYIKERTPWVSDFSRSSWNYPRPPLVPPLGWHTTLTRPQPSPIGLPVKTFHSPFSWPTSHFSRFESSSKRWETHWSPVVMKNLDVRGFRHLFSKDLIT